ncbi:hypothetical protein ASD99_21195 [Mesorhizobium sp. Root695]|uniref:hypothetical protein n=1 Tax=Mesorhizobium sp. Root695 TaxID=1736589 RepID=UPI0007093052|nr:hypothetical protein ASD99_21195 [Mesorhizobium sp. Root695]
MVAMNRNNARSIAHLIRSGWFKAVHLKSVQQAARPRERDTRPASAFGLKVGRVSAGGFDARVRALVNGIGPTIVDLLTDKEKLARCKAEFEERTGGGIGGSRWVAPLLGENHAPPIDDGWPEYVLTTRGFEWCVPVSA